MDDVTAGDAAAARCCPAGMTSSPGGDDRRRRSAAAVLRRVVVLPPPLLAGDVDDARRCRRSRRGRRCVRTVGTAMAARMSAGRDLSRSPAPACRGSARDLLAAVAEADDAIDDGCHHDDADDAGGDEDRPLQVVDRPARRVPPAATCPAARSRHSRRAPHSARRAVRAIRRRHAGRGRSGISSPESVGTWSTLVMCAGGLVSGSW